MRVTKFGKVPYTIYKGVCNHCKGEFELEKAEFLKLNKKKERVCPTKNCNKVVIVKEMLVQPHIPNVVPPWASQPINPYDQPLSWSKENDLTKNLPKLKTKKQITA